MIWPTVGGVLSTTANWYNVTTSATAETVNAALASANATELKKGQTVAFLVRGGDIGVLLGPGR
jgi:precorrin-2 methylase